MKTAALIIRLIFVWWFQLRKCSAQGLSQTAVQSKCRDRYLWIHVVSGRTPRFEAVDDHGVHSISVQLASQCGYTIRTSKMDGFTILRASYYSCFTQNQNDEVFTFRFNVMVRDAHGHWTNQPVSAVCSGFTLSDREIICEEDYMEVNVNRQSTCEGGDAGQTWQAAFAEAQRMASSVWQLMFLRGDEQVYSMSVSEAKKLGYSLTASAQRLVLRAQYNQPQAEIKMIEEVPVEVIRVSLFFKKKLMVLMIDMSMACAVNSGSFKDGWLLLEVPQVMSPLVGEGVDYQSNSIRLGVDGMLLEESLAAARGIHVVQHGQKIQIGVPFGTEGGYRKSLVVKNSYKETYMIFLLYEHIFSMLYEDGSSIDTRHRLLRKLGTPLICHIPFTINQTVADNQVFSVYLGNIPVDVVLEDLWINGKQLQMSEKLGYSIKYSVHNNGSKAYQLQLPFKDSVVQQMYLGEGVVQYSIDINFTLTIMPQRESYYHQTTITARVFNAFPPEITAQCLDRAIVFSVAGSSQTLWEIGVDKTPLTSELAVQRGYLLSVQNQKTVLEIPLFSIGYTYEEINLSNFYATFELLLRDPKSLAVQTSTSKRCLFKTQDMMVCSTDGTMTVVAALSSTWPSVKPERTTLLDPACVPKQTDGSRVLFEFKVDSCGTRNTVGDTYMVYENEIFHNRQLIPDGPNFISRDSNFKLTVRCFYLLSGVNRLSVDRTFRSEAPGFGLVDVFKSLKDPGNRPAAEGCVMENTVNFPSHRVHQTTASGGVGHQSSHRGDPDRQKASQPSTNYLRHPEASGIETHQVASEASSGLYNFHNREQQAAGLSARDHSHSIPPGYDHRVDISLQLSNLSTQNLNFVVRGENMDLTDATLAIDSGSSKVPSHPVIGQLKIDSGQSEASRLLGPTRQVKNIWHSGPNNPSSVSPGHKQHQDPQGLKLDLGMKTQNLQKRLDMEFSLFGSPDDGNHLNSEGTRGLQHQYMPLHFPAQAQHSPGQSGKRETYPSGKPQPTTLQGKLDPLRFASREQVSSARSQSEQSLERPGSTEWRKTNALYSKVHNVRVKPPSRFVSSVNTLRQKPMVQPLNSASTVLSSQEHVANGVWEGKQVQTTDLDQTSTTVSPNQQMPLHNPVHSPSSQSLFYQLAGTKYDSALKNVQAAATPQVGARPPSFRTETNGPTFGKGR
ncbi:uncharacterized protein isoform X1 [Takifugu rubripes]|uniref:uncharacterized protein isoform X1 n=2 Tax=Takifugu rubripes TaxID=31033 RepID=UPI001145E35E|nr:uncharacterized protein LOC105417527 isoform X1 [Takifugu rubripes]